MYLRYKAVGYAVAERDKGHDDKRREHVTDIVPVDLGDLSDHHAANLDDLGGSSSWDSVTVLRSTYKNQGAARGPGRDGREYRRKEDGTDEAETRHNGSQSRATALSNPSAALDEGRHGRAAKERRNGYKRGVDAVRGR